jgi:uncharacterized membrane protein YbhN (UPF0104 family)
VSVRAVLRTAAVLAALGVGFGFLSRAVPWADRCKSGVAVALCAPDQIEPGLRSVVATMDPALLAAGAFVYALGALVWAKRWHCVLAVAQGAPGYRVLLRACVEAYAAMALLVGGVGGDALRLGVLVSSGVGAPWAAASLAIDRVIGLVALLTTALLVAAPELVRAYPLAVIALPALVVLLVAGVLVALVAPLPRAVPGTLRRVIEAVRGPYGAAPVGVALRALGRAFGTSVVAAAMQLGAFGLFLRAAHATPASVAKVVAGIVEAFVVNAIPTVPGGWGTGEAAFVFFLRPAGILEAQALAASVAFRLSVLPVAAVGVVSLALRARRSPR